MTGGRAPGTCPRAPRGPRRAATGPLPGARGVRAAAAVWPLCPPGTARTLGQYSTMGLQTLTSPPNVRLSEGDGCSAPHSKKDTFSLNSSRLLSVTVKKSFKDYQYRITKSEVICLQNIYRT